MSTSFWLDQSDKHSQQSFDVVIVGAGISGASLAYWLKQEDPNLKVAILEKNEVASGATGRNAGFVTCGSVEHFNRMVGKHGEQQALDIWKFAEENMNLLKQYIIDSPQELNFEQTGSFSLAAQSSEWKELQDVANFMKKHNIPVELYQQSEIKKRTGAEGFVGGILYKNDGAVDPVKLTQKILTLSQAKLFSQTEVYQIVSTESGNRLLNTNKGSFECSMVILALNGYSASLNSYFADKIYPTRGQILMMEPVKKFMAAPCYANFYLDYFRQLSSGHLLIGGFRQLEKETEVGYSDHITDKIQQALHDFVNKHLPQFAHKKVTHRWSGIMGFSSDGEPMVGSLPDDPQAFFCGGYTGHGIGMAFHVAKQLVNLAFGREIPHWLSAKRF